MAAGLHVVLHHVGEDPGGAGSCYLRPECVADKQPAQLKGAVHKYVTFSSSTSKWSESKTIYSLKKLSIFHN